MAYIVNGIRETVIMPDGTCMRIAPSLSPERLPSQATHIHLAGLSEVPKGYRIERRNYEVCEILFSLEGVGRVRSDGTTSDILPGDVLIAPSFTHYAYECARPVWQFAWFHFEGLGPWHPSRALPVHVREAHWGRQVERAMASLLAESISHESNRTRMTTLLSEQVILYVERELTVCESPRNLGVRRRLEDLWDCVSGRLDKTWTVPELAARINMSESTFQRACLRLTGLTPNRMLVKLKMQRAEGLLLRTDYPLKSIAAMLGYASPFSFSAAFKQYNGVSPSEFREQPSPDDRT